MYVVLSTQKTESIVLNPDSGEEYPSTIIRMQGVDIVNVKKFRYLGAYKTFDAPGISDEELAYRIAMAHGKFA